MPLRVEAVDAPVVAVGEIEVAVAGVEFRAARAGRFVERWGVQRAGVVDRHAPGAEDLAGAVGALASFGFRTLRRR